MDQWFCIVNGQQYGPVSFEVLRQWARDRRLLAGDLVWRGGMERWAPAGAVPGLMPPPGSALLAAPASGPAQADGEAVTLAAHRGVLVLVLGLVGLIPACVFICGIVAWVIGSRDLREMDAGRMDPSGRGLTQAGRICGLVGFIIGCVFTIIMGLYIGFVAWMIHSFSTMGP